MYYLYSLTSRVLGFGYTNFKSFQAKLKALQQFSWFYVVIFEGHVSMIILRHENIPQENASRAIISRDRISINCFTEYIDSTPSVENTNKCLTPSIREL